MTEYKNKDAFALIAAIGITLIMGLMAFYIFDYMIPFSKNTKGIENSARAYYQAETSIEDALYFTNKIRSDYSTESGTTLTVGPLGNSFSMQAKGDMLPPSGKGNSEFDSNWNIIRIGDPIQLDIGNNMITTWSNFYLKFRVPDLDLDDNNNETLSGSSTPIVNWQLSSQGDTLNASGSWITEGDIDGNTIIDFSKVGYKEGINLSGENQDFDNFYGSECDESGEECSLKLSVVNKLELDDANGTPVPYLEWRIDAGTSIPLRYTNIYSVGKSFGFKKNLEVRIPQQTVNEAFDFTVFQ